MTPEQERAAFEAFASKHGLCVTEGGDLYRSHVVAWMWKAWQARAAIEARTLYATPQPAEPVKSHLIVSYDVKYDVLYVDCNDNNEPFDADEDDKGILYRRAISDGRLVGITISNFMGPHAKAG